jgi:hypothetical protein
MTEKEEQQGFALVGGTCKNEIVTFPASQHLVGVDLATSESYTIMIYLDGEIIASRSVRMEERKQ